MNASVSVERNNWRAPKDETIQIVHPKQLKKLKGDGVATYVDKVRLHVHDIMIIQNHVIIYLTSLSY